LHRVMEMKDYAHDEAFGDLIALMLEKGANPDLRDIKGFTPVHYAIKNRHEVGFNALMSEEAEFNDRIGSLKELNYLQYFDKNWRKNAEARQKLIDKTGLTIPGKKKKKKK